MLLTDKQNVRTTFIHGGNNQRMLESCQVLGINMRKETQRGHTTVAKGQSFHLQLDKTKDFLFPFNQDSIANVGIVSKSLAYEKMC
jgi:hypothetical protein